jgi:hypothetical protein
MAPDATSPTPSPDDAERGRKSRSVGILAFGQTEVLDFTGTHEVFNVTSKLRTSAGVSAGIDLVLEAVEGLGDRTPRAAVEEEMEWGWNFQRSAPGSGLQRCRARRRVATKAGAKSQAGGIATVVGLVCAELS